MFNDHEPVLIDEFNGWFDRDGADIETPRDHAYICDNVDFSQGGIRSRNSISGTAFSLAPGVSAVFLQEFVRSSGSRSWIYMGQATKQLYHTGATVPATPIYTPLGTPSGFSMLSVADRAYITPHNYSSGDPAEFLYVYYWNGAAWVFRKAAGAKPVVGTFAAATSAAPGVIGAGVHLIRIAYETDTGFITKLSSAIQYTAPGGKAIDLTNIPTGPSYVVARHIVMTKAIVGAYDGNQDNYEPFFVTKLNDNVTTSLQINQYDSALVNSAKYLFDVLEEIPAGLGLSLYATRLMLWNFGANSEYNIIRASKSNDYETFDAIDSIVRVNPADGGSRGITTCDEYRGTLIINKRGKMYATSDNGSEPVDWPAPSLLDGGVGTQAVNGIARLEQDQTGIHRESLFLADWSGLHLFQGSIINPEFPLTWKIHNIWKNIDLSVFPLLQVAVSSASRKIYILVPSLYNGGSWEPNFIIVGDYSQGLTYQDIRWSKYDVPAGPLPGTPFSAFASILLEPLNQNSGNTSGLIVAYHGQNTVYRMVGTTAGIDSGIGLSVQTHYESGWIYPGDSLETAHIAGVRVLAYCQANVDLTIQAVTGNNPITSSVFIVPASTSSTVTKTFNADMIGERFKYIISLSTNGTITDIKVYKLVVFVAPQAESVPL